VRSEEPRTLAPQSGQWPKADFQKMSERNCMESGYSSRPCKQAKQKAGHLAAAGLDSRTQRSLLGGGLTHLEAGETDDRDFFADLGLGGGDEVLNLLVGIAEVSLF